MTENTLTPQLYIDPVWWYQCVEDLAAGDTVMPNDRLRIVTKTQEPQREGVFVALADASCGERVLFGEIKFGVLRPPVPSDEGMV